MRVSLVRFSTTVKGDPLLMPRSSKLSSGHAEYWSGSWSLLGISKSLARHVRSRSVFGGLSSRFAHDKLIMLSPVSQRLKRP